ncbi:MAG TPA: dihydrodipicolinate synthase family protein, partial [Gemmatales bacterium]|nr:dihydrodipicolinate synthase family protein [Gemmatales bacterium]
MLRTSCLLLFFLIGTAGIPAEEGCSCPWAGVYPTVLTPWHCHADGVDTAALEAQLRYQLQAPIHGVLLLGTLGEGMYASEAERCQVIATANEVIQGKIPIIVGIHTADVTRAIAQAKQAQALGAQAVLVKYTGCARFCEILSFYHTLADQSPLPVFYYHI